MAAAASAFCRTPAIGSALTQRTSGLPPHLEAGLQECAAGFASASGNVSVFDSLGGSQDALQHVRGFRAAHSKHMRSSLQRWDLMYCVTTVAQLA